jgi:hypothetical protein
MKKVVAEKELADYRNRCGDELKKCEKAVNYGIAENEKRTDEMWKNCKNLTKNTE